MCANRPQPGAARARGPDREQRPRGKARPRRLEKADALSDNVCFHHWRTDRVWTRDSDCIFLKPSEDTRNSCGSSRSTSSSMPQPNTPTTNLTKKLAGAWRGPRAHGSWSPSSGDHRVVLEGGSIDVNGCGTLLTTEECLLSTEQQRNPPMDRVAYEQMFADYFGVQSVIWLGGGIAGDDTHGHVDDITRFVAPDTVVTMIEPNAQDENYSALRKQPATPESGPHARWPKARDRRIPMPRPSSLRAAACRPAMPTSTSPTAQCWCPSSTIPTTASRLNPLAESLPHPRDRAHLLRRLDLGLRRAALHDAAAASGSQ